MTPDRIIYDKLVRDLIPAIIQREGNTPEWSCLSPGEIVPALMTKLVEEAHELLKATDRGELAKEMADVTEVLRAIAERSGITWSEVETLRKLRAQERGTFSGGIYLHAVASATAATEPATTTKRRPALRPRVVMRSAEPSLIDIVLREIEESISVSIASAFYGRWILNVFDRPLCELADRGGRVRLLTSVMNDFNNPDDLVELERRVPGLSVRVFYPAERSGLHDFTNPPPPFHLKCFLFERPSGRNSLLIGSSNITRGGFVGNHEWNYYSNSEVNAPTEGTASVFENALAEFERYWGADAVTLTDEFLNPYRVRWAQAHEHRLQAEKHERTATEASPHPRPAQAEALANLARKRELGVKRTAVIAATGLGKTHLAAFDFQQSGCRRLLFVAHREIILNQARQVFRAVLGQPNFGVMLSGTADPAERARASEPNAGVFAMIQIISKEDELARFDRRAFDYVVVDEFHHTPAESYERLLRYLEPRFLLGLTATPERLDGRDVLRWCDYDVAYEARLFDALDRGWLVPFQYFAIYDPTDYSQIRWTQRGYDDEDLDGLLIDDTRAELVIRNLNRYLPAEGKLRALAFCSSKAHAEYMTRRFNELGRTAVCILGETPPAERSDAMDALASQDSDLEILCSVEVLGEGVDVPSVTHVLFLRPTQSFALFVQQLGRGLRPALGKDFVVALDFVGNFHNSYVAPLALQGFRSVNERMEAGDAQAVVLPSGCHVSADTEVQRIWTEQMQRILEPRAAPLRLAEVYSELRQHVEHSPQLLDFYANPEAHDPFVFIREYGSWLRAKEELDQTNGLTEYEQSLLGTPGEDFLRHLEAQLNAVRSFKMVVVMCLLQVEGTQTRWSVAEIAARFRAYYLAHREYLTDYAAMARAPDPATYPLRSVESHLIRMPLRYLADSDDKFFILHVEERQFELREPVRPFWSTDRFRDLVRDRATFALLRYSNTRGAARPRPRPGRAPRERN
jgi:superfamily II DNA or RNA helicase/predicted house-cleaning noncanonical NTP pyrophosphatase (MazG superfamily)/HKD family nuclease